MTMLDEFSPERVRAMRRGNDQRFKGWSAQRIVKFHQKTLDETAYPDEYLDGIRTHLASGVYRRLYPPHVVEATRLFLSRVNRGLR